MNKNNLIIFIVIMLLTLIISVSSFVSLSIKKEVPAPEFFQLAINEEINENKKLESFFGNIEDYEAAFASVQDSEKMQVIAGITSHHFLAKNLIARFYSGISGDIENVFLIGPDHYNALNLEDIDVVTTKLIWNTPYGELESNKELIQNILSKNSNIKIDDDIFKMEHSIYTEVPFIKKAFPQAKIIPLIIKNTYDYNKFMKFGENLNKTSKGRTLMVVSSDFSHEATIDDAKKQDEQSRSILKDLKLNNLNEITCDCRSCMAVMLGFLEKDKKFHFIENKNSADFGSPDETVTSYLNGYFLVN